MRAHRPCSWVWPTGRSARIAGWRREPKVRYGCCVPKSDRVREKPGSPARQRQKNAGARTNPLVVKDMVIVGSSGAEYGVRGHIGPCGDCARGAERGGALIGFCRLSGGTVAGGTRARGRTAARHPPRVARSSYRHGSDGSPPTACDSHTMVLALSRRSASSPTPSHPVSLLRALSSWDSAATGLLAEGSLP